MAEFSVKTNTVKEAANVQGSLLNELEQIQQSVRKISGSLDIKTAAATGIKNRLNGLVGRMEAQKAGMRSMKNALDTVAQLYEETERNICGYAEGEIKKRKQPDMAGTHSVLKGMALDKLLLIPPAFLKGSDTFDCFIDKLKGGSQNKLENATSFKWQGKVNGALYDKEISGEKGSLGVTAGTYEAYVDAEGGLFTEDEEGNRIFNPNVDAKMGASYSLLTAAGTFATGNEVFGAHADGEITVGQISGNAQAKASLRDRNGNINPNAKISASMEAVAVKAEAQAGVTVLGTDVKASGSAYVGLGAHADVEVGNGKIKCDFGAALGIGVSVGIEIDYGGAVNAIQKAASSIFSKFKL